MSAIERLKRTSEMQKINAWLDKIGEHDPACRQEVIDLADKDADARAFYVEKYEGKL